MPEKKSFAKSLIQSLGESRDAKIGAVGAQQIRDAYSEGNNMWADLYAKQLTGANALGISGALLGNAWASSPFVRVGLDTAGSIDGMRNFFSGNGIQKTIRKYKEGDYWGAAKSGFGDILDMTGIGDLYKISSRILKPGYRALHAYNNVQPFGYDKSVSRGISYLKDLITNPKVNISKPRWLTDLSKSDHFHGFTPSEIRTRQDAWAKYLGLPEINKSYVRNPDGTFRFSDSLNEKVKNQLLRFKNTYRGVDAFGTHGGLWYDDIVIHPNGSATWKTGDVWDLNPFEKKKLTLQDRAHGWIQNKRYTGTISSIKDFGLNLADKAVNSKLWTKISDKVAKFEIGPIVGGHPFTLNNEMHLSPEEFKKLIDKNEGPSNFLKPSEQDDYALIQLLELQEK